MFYNETWIDFYLLGSDELDVAMIWWFFFFFFLIWIFGSGEILVGSGQWAVGNDGEVGMVVVVW